MAKYLVGQLWLSEAEPELGLGRVQAAEFKRVTIEFNSAGATRSYNALHAPLLRAEFSVGDVLATDTGQTFTVASLRTDEGLIWYGSAEGEQFSESHILSEQQSNRPEKRLQSGQTDSVSSYYLRQLTWNYLTRTLSSEARGFLGPRIEILPHQLFIAQEIAKRGRPRALLADEVGLGKTIEAGWILHQLMVSRRVKKALILVPQALQSQWFVEMLRRFNLGFSIPEVEVPEEEWAELIGDRQRVILSHEVIAKKEIAQAVVDQDWEMVIVDEVHRFETESKDGKNRWTVLSILSEISPGLLLLTATPERLGLEQHFNRLRLLDPDRFSDFDAYLEEYQRYQEVVQVAQGALEEKKPSNAIVQMLEGKVDQKLLENAWTPDSKRKAIEALVDYYGTGRIHFKNSRKTLASEGLHFKERELHAVEHPDEKAKLQWLSDWIKANPDQKALLIASSKELAQKIEKHLSQFPNIRTALFHEAQNLQERDRAAAYFASPLGAQILLCSEIGGEGRNFQFAHHLILFDLPEHPDVLEQRLGRLDRIGQKENIQVHVPLVAKAPQRRLMSWYDEVLQAFRAPVPGAATVHRELFEKYPKEVSVEQARARVAEVQEELKKGQDQLIEYYSFDRERAHQAVDQIEANERATELKTYLFQLFDIVGVHVEDLDGESWFVEPGDDMFIPHFPGLPDTGLRVTFSREKALVREDLTLLSWDHPMVVDVMETILSQENGSVCRAVWKDQVPPEQQQHLLEIQFALQASLEDEWYIDEYLPPQTMRLVLNHQGQDLTDQFERHQISQNLKYRIPKRELAAHAKLTSEERPIVSKLVDHAQTQADAWAKDLKAKAHKHVLTSIKAEIKRLKTLQAGNALVSDEEISWWQNRGAALLDGIERASLRIDNLVWVTPLRSPE